MKKYLPHLLGVFFGCQLIGVGYKIWQHYHAKNAGEVFLFQTAPIDPRDPFRGQYVALNFDLNGEHNFPACTDEKGEQIRRQGVYVSLNKTSEGIAEIQSISLDKPSTTAYLHLYKVYCTYRDSNELQKIRINLPFNRYYVNENEAQSIEDRARRHPDKTFLQVWVYRGEYAVDRLSFSDEE